jgi:hypothetical protein
MPSAKRKIEAERTTWRFVGMGMALFSPYFLMLAYHISAEFQPYTRSHFSIVLLAVGTWIAVSVFMSTRQFSMKWMLLAALLVGVAGMVPQMINCSCLFPKP